MKVRFGVSIDEGVVKEVDALAAAHVDGNRSLMIENLLRMALMDASLMKKFGLVDLGRMVQKLQDRMREAGIQFKGGVRP